MWNSQISKTHHASCKTQACYGQQNSLITLAKWT